MRLNKFDKFVNEGKANFTDEEKEAIREATKNYMNNAVEDFLYYTGDNAYEDICNELKVDLSDKLDQLGYGNPGEINEEVKEAFIDMLTETFMKMFEDFEE